MQELKERLEEIRVDIKDLATSLSETIKIIADHVEEDLKVQRDIEQKLREILEKVEKQGS